MMTGIFRDMDARVYRAQAAFGGGAAAALAVSTPAHYRASLGVTETPAMRLGTAAHVAILEGWSAYQRAYRVAPDCDRRKKKDREKLDTFAMECERAGAIMLTRDEHAAVDGMYESVRVFDAAQSLLDETAREVSLFWTCPETGVDCRARLDFYAERGIVGDLKTARSASLRAFRWAVMDRGYHVQAGHYIAGMRACGLEPPPTFHFIVVETSGSYEPAVYELDAPSLALGERLALESRRKWRAAMDSGKWDGYPDVVQPLSLPGCEMSGIDSAIEL